MMAGPSSPLGSILPAVSSHNPQAQNVAKPSDQPILAPETTADPHAWKALQPPHAPIDVLLAVNAAQLIRPPIQLSNDDPIRPILAHIESEIQNSSLAQTAFDVAVAALSLFVQAAWTGPHPLFALSDAFCLPPQTDQNAFDRSAVALLAVDGEPAYPLTPIPLLLLVAKTILVDNAQAVSSIPTAPWWTARCAFVHQRIVDNPSASLQSTIFSAYELVAARIPPSESDRDLNARFHIERGLVHHFYGQDQKAVSEFKLAQTASQLSWSLTGALGKRTKFQSFDVAQLVLDATSTRTDPNQHPQETQARSAADPKTVPENLALNDDTLLETISITQPNAASQSKLSTIDQCILLAFCLNVKNTNPMHGLTIEEMQPYVRRILENPNNWMVHTMALLLRSRLESNKYRTVERAALQLQALIDQFPLAEPSAEQRMQYIYSLMIPPKWELERELGERFVSLGVIRSALEIFERLHLWEDVVSCHQMLEQPQKAESIVRDLLRENPDSPKFHCILGDILNDISEYETAWEISGKRYARAMRSLGAHYFKQSEWQQCVDCYAKALAINPLYENSWFVMGCAAMRINDYDTSISAFSRVTNINPDNGEAWNNLSSAYIKQRKLREAFHGLREALRCEFDASNVWENYLFVCVDLGEFSEAIRAMERIFDIRADKPKFSDRMVDLEVLDIIVLAVIGDQLDANGDPSSRHTTKLSNLLTKMQSKIASPTLFTICARFYQSQHQLRHALEWHQKSYRTALNRHDIGTDAAAFTVLCNKTLEYIAALLELGPQHEPHRMSDTSSSQPDSDLVCKDYLYQARQALKTVLGRTRDGFSDHEMYRQLEDQLESIKSIASAGR